MSDKNNNLKPPIIKSGIKKQGTNPVEIDKGSVFVKGPKAGTYEQLTKTNDGVGRIYSRKGIGGSTGLKKMAAPQVARMAPKPFSPLFEESNLMLPRDRKTLAAWCRHYLATDPIIRNAISLHAQYPVSKFELECEDTKVKNLIGDMLDDLDITSILHGIGMEFFGLGECFPFVELDENEGLFSGIILHNPDYIEVRANVLSKDPIINLVPDENLKNIINSAAPEDLKMRAQLDPTVIRLIQHGKPIPLDNFNITQLAHKLHSYDVRGTSLIVSCFKDLMHRDKLREMQYCYLPGTKITLDDFSYKNIEDVNKEDKVLTHTGIEQKVLSLGGREIKEDVYEFISVGFPKPTTATSNHPFLVVREKSLKCPKGLKQICKLDDKDICNYYWAKGIGKVKRTKPCKGTHVDLEFIKARDIKIGDYLVTPIPQIETTDNFTKEQMRLFGFFTAEGSYIKYNYNSAKKGTKIGLTFSLNYNEKDTLGKEIDELCLSLTGKHVTYVDSKERGVCLVHIHDEQLAQLVYKNTGEYSHHKKLSKEIISSSKELLAEFLGAYILGDGHQETILDNRGGVIVTTSRQLAEQITFICYKLEIIPYLHIVPSRSGDINTKTQKQYINSESYRINIYKGDINKISSYCDWETSEPMRHFGKRFIRDGYIYSQITSINKRYYEGFVYNFEVENDHSYIADGRATHNSIADNYVVPLKLFKVGDPNGDFRPNDADIQDFQAMVEEAMYDPNFILITHGAVQVEIVGWGQSVYGFEGDLERIYKNIMMGLWVPEQLLTTGEGGAKSNASVGLEILKNRYVSYRNVIERWLEKKIFEPICKIHKFYKTEDGKKKLIIPKVRWNRIILKDVDQYVNTLTQLLPNGIISPETILDSLDLNTKEENIKSRRFQIKNILQQKELQLLSAMAPSQLLTIDPEKSIFEQLGTLPGEVPAGGPAAGGAPGGAPGGGAPGGGGGGDLASLLGGGGGGGAPGGMPGGDMGAGSAAPLPGLEGGAPGGAPGGEGAPM